MLDRSNFSSLYFSTQYLFSQAPGILGTALRALWGRLNTQKSQALSLKSIQRNLCETGLKQPGDRALSLRGKEKSMYG